MNRIERIELLNRELTEISELLSGVALCQQIPEVLLKMLCDKSARLAEGMKKLSNDDSFQATEDTVNSNELLSQDEEVVIPPKVVPQRPIQTKTVYEFVEIKKNEKNSQQTDTHLSIDNPIEKQEADKVSTNVNVMATVEDQSSNGMKSETDLLNKNEKDNLIVEAPVQKAFEKVFTSFKEEPVSTTSVNDIRRLLTLNDRFLFQRELFRGDVGMLNYTLDQINQMDTLEKALEFLNTSYHWREDAPGVPEFLELVERHFTGTII